jgi:hypothetical protein
MIETIGIIVVALVALLLAIAAMKPDTFRIERRASIHAPMETIFPFINEFDRWSSWSPWEAMDPALKRTRRGPAAGKGAVYEWEGNNKVGQGRMEIKESVPPSKVTIQLDFIKPYRARNVAEFTLQGRGGSTDVTWAMHGPQPFMMKVMGALMNMDKMIGKNFETGLANLKIAAER